MDLFTLNVESLPSIECELGEKSSVSSSKKHNGAGDEFVSPSFKNKSSKESPRSSTNLLIKVTPQIKKPTHRKNSPISWIPRKKVDSYLDRKIRLLQEAGGMSKTLDETLGNSNPHYCRVEREKIAAREAASRALEARKSAMIEASWCRILKAARIQSKEAESQLLKAQKSVAEALAAAREKGVIMYDTLDTPVAKPSTTHTVRASFETAFEVDKQVAAAVKSAFVKLANCPSSLSKDEHKDLLRKISENPDNSTDSRSSSNYKDLPPELSSEEEYYNNIGEESTANDVKTVVNTRQSGPADSRNDTLEDFMLERLKCLQEEELASLATIVATCGLNAALAQEEDGRGQDPSSHASTTTPRVYRNYSVEYFINGPTRRNTQQATGAEGVPSLDKFLVKRKTKLEKEVQEAMKSRKSIVNVTGDGNKVSENQHESSDLGSYLGKKHSSKLQMEIEEQKTNNHDEQVLHSRKPTKVKKAAEEIPSLEQCLVKHVSRLEREVREARKSRISVLDVEHNINDKENVYQKAKNAEEVGGGGLDKILVKPVCRVEMEKKRASLWWGTEDEIKQSSASCRKPRWETEKMKCESLDQVLVKSVSRLEKEKIVSKKRQNEEEEDIDEKRKEKNIRTPSDNAENGGLEQMLVKHSPKLEREKMAAFCEELADDGNAKCSVRWRREREKKELQDVWGGIGLGDSIRPRVIRLQREKDAWLKAEEEERRRIMMPGL